jgi:hypothetical protein
MTSIHIVPSSQKKVFFFMEKYKINNIDSLGFLATNARDEVYQVFEQHKKRILEGSSGARGEEVELHTKYVVAVVKDQKISFLKTVPIQLDTVPRNAVESNLVLNSKEKRIQLGEAFGTRKKKQQLRQQEINQIQVDTLGDVKQMTERIGQTSLPRQHELEEQIMNDRLIPPCNTNAAIPGEVYNIDDICPPYLVKLINVKLLWKARTLPECLEYLKGLKLGRFLQDLIEETLKEKKDKTRLRQVLVI